MNPIHSAELTELAAGLNRLARNLWWSWDQQAQEVFYDLSPRGWQNLYHNAVAILREVSAYELRVRLRSPDSLIESGRCCADSMPICPTQPLGVP